MPATILINTVETWPGAFVLFLTVAITLCVIGEWILGRRWGEAPLPWAALIAAGVFGAVVGSKVYTSHLASWAHALAEGALPTVHGKNLLGAVAGTLVFVWGLRRLLRSRAPFEDALGLVLPVAILVGRAGCLFAGCCHGTVSSVPWALRYQAGSLAHGHQVLAGLIPPGAPTSLPIHPAQIYEMLLVAALIPLVFRAHRRLRRPGAALLVTVIGYGAIRFVQEFVRYGGAEVHGLKPVQWGLLAVVSLAAFALLRRLRAPIPAAVPATVLPIAGWRLSVLSALTVFAAWTAFTWFGPGEFFCVLLASLPLGWHGAEALAVRFVPSLSPRWRRLVPVGLTVAALGAWTPLIKTPKGPPDAENVLKVEVGGGGGLQHYDAGGTCEEPPRIYTDEVRVIEGAISYQRHLSDRQYAEGGIKAYGATIGRREGRPEGVRDWSAEFHSPMLQAELPVPYRIIGVEPWVGYEGYWFAAHFGVHLYGSPEFDTGLKGMAAGKVRFFPKEFFYVESMFLHDTTIIAGPPFRLGVGIGLGPLGSLRTGLGVGAMLVPVFYLQPDLSFKVGSYEVFLSPEFYIGGHPRDTFAVTGTLGLSIPLR